MSLGSSELGAASAELGTIELAALGSGGTPGLDQIVDQTLSFTQTASAQKWIPRSITDTLSFTQTAVGEKPHQDVTQTLTFTQTATIHSGIINKSVLQTLAFTETLGQGGTKNISVNQTLAFQQFVNRTADLAVLQTLDFSDTVTDSKAKYATQSLIFSETIIANKVFNRSLSQTLTFTQKTNVGRPLRVNQQLVITQSFQHAYVFHSDCEMGTLGDTQLGDFFLGLDCGADPKAFVTQNLAFTETLVLERVWHRTVTQQLTFTQSSVLGPWIRDRSIEQTLDFYDGFYPKQIENVGTTVSLPIVVITKVQKFVTMTSSFGAIVLPVPIFDDTVSTNNSVAIARVMSRKAYSYVRSSNRVKLSYEYHVGRNKSLELRQFAINNTDDYVTLTNWKGEVYYGKISNNPVVLTTKSRFANEFEAVNIVIEFQGVKVSG